MLKTLWPRKSHLLRVPGFVVDGNGASNGAHWVGIKIEHPVVLFTGGH